MASSSITDAQVRAFFSDSARTEAAPTTDTDAGGVATSGVPSPDTAVVASSNSTSHTSTGDDAASSVVNNAQPTTPVTASVTTGIATDAPEENDGTDAPDDPASGALFDYSSYTGGAPSLLSVATNSSSTVSTTTNSTNDSAAANVVAAASSLFSHDLDAVSRELLASPTATTTTTTTVNSPATATGSTNKPSGHDTDERRIGRPSHPAWAYFARGEKRNRFHHNAYCRYCSAHGVDPEPIRGVSENMIRHLHKCVYCPEDVVAQLKTLCAQKDAARFSKRHQTLPTDVDLLLHDAVGGASAAAMTKRMRLSSHSAADASTNSSHSAVVDEFMPLHLPLLASELGGSAATGLESSASTASTAATALVVDTASSSLVLPPSSSASSSSGHQRARLREQPTKRVAGRASAVAAPRPTAAATAMLPDSSDLQHHQQQAAATDSSNAITHKPVDAAVLNHLAATATLSADLPSDWLRLDETARLLGAATHAKLQLPLRPSALEAAAAASRTKQLATMRDDAVGVTLAISSWTSKCTKASVAVFSLVNALGEATVWEVLDLGLGDVSTDVLADKVKRALLALHATGVHVISIVADSLLAYAAARFAVSAMEHSSHDIPVLPCFAHVLSLLLGVVLTAPDGFADTMGDVIAIVQMFSNQRVVRALRRECGDPDASLVLPATDRWYSFIECIDSVRQYEDMIKIIAAKVLAVSGDSSFGTGTGTGTGANTGTGTANSVFGPSGSTSTSAPLLSSHRPMRKDSAGNSADELADVQLSPSILHTILNPAFWEHVVSLSELVSPIKETYKLLAGSGSGSTSTSTSTSSASRSAAHFTLSDVLYQCGRMHQQFGVILSDWDDSTTTCSRRTLELVRFMQDTVETLWKLYDQPLVVLSYVLNYNLVDFPHVSRGAHASLQWLAIGKYAKEYFRRWFCTARDSVGSSSAGVGRSAAGRPALSEDTPSRFLDDVLAYKERKYPFDAESVCEFEHPRAFYALVSDSHPLMHIFGARLFSVATTTPPALADVVPGSSFVASAATTGIAHTELFSALQLRLFAHTAVRPSKELLAYLQSATAPRASRGVAGTDDSVSGGSRSSSIRKELLLDCGLDARVQATVWSKRQWTRLAREWRAHWERETDTDELLRTLALLDPGLFRFAPNVSLDQIFKDKLPSRLPHDREDAVVDV